MTTIHPIFSECVTTTPSRYQLDRVAVQKGHRWATDGAILVREPAPEPDDVVVLPDFKHLRFDATTIGLLPLLIDVPAGDRKKCQSCHQGECANCKTEGKCQSCGGRGEYFLPVPVLIQESGDRKLWLSSKYLAVLKRHGVTALEVIGDAASPLRFRVPGTAIVGLVMPCDGPDVRP